METLSKFFAPGIVFLLTVASGFWLSLSGKPLNTAKFNIHKLIALGFVIFTSIQIINIMKTMETQALLILLIVISALCIVALFATGALMSMGKLSYALMLTIHRVAPVLAVVFLGLTVYLLMGKKL